MARQRTKTSKMQIEDAFKRLEEIVSLLEDGKLPLEESIKIFSEGMKLLEFCQKKLEEAQKTVQKLIKENARDWKLEPFGMSENSEEEAPF